MDRHESVKFLINATQSSSFTPNQRLRAVEALGEAGTAEARAHLHKVTQSGASFTPAQREAAVLALGRASRPGSD